MSNLESTIQANILRYLKRIPKAYCVRPIVCHESGHPDIIAVINGQFVGIEVKRPGKKPTVLQRKRIDQIIAAGGHAFVAFSVDDVKIELDKLRKLIKLSPSPYCNT